MFMDVFSVRRSFLAVVVAAALIGGPPHAVGPASAQATEDDAVVEGPTSILVATTATGVYPFDVEIAATPETRARGLMYRRAMADDHGMLFDMGGVGQAAFWMENTFISLDIVFIGADGRVVNVAADAKPMSKALITSDGPVRWVLELKAGTAARIGLAPGDAIRHDLIAK